MSRPVVAKWIGEFCAPVVVTIATAEAENMSLKNGLLLHELLSSFGHLDGLNSTVRVGSQNFAISDAHVRFERVTELRAKNSDVVEELLKRSFEEFDITRLPSSVPELKAAPPSAWTPKMEQIVMRSLGFTEFEMISHPLILLTVVATTDVDHFACLQELTSIHHTPTCFSTGQYDPQMHRVFLLLDDASVPKDKKGDAQTILKSLKQRCHPHSVKLLTINSLSAQAQNLQQPDMWSRFLIPSYFPQHAPAPDPNVPPPRNPLNNTIVIGSRLSMEDFMLMREFCIELFNFEIVPCIERRLTQLNKQVSDSRKGMKNVLKSFWRKPRDESDNVKGGVKYRFDKVESQILLLADTSFMIKDYETAQSMYKLVRDDYKADKSTLHVAHTTLMLAACHMITEPNKTKDLYGYLDSIGQLLSSQLELPIANAYFALLASEMYVYHHQTRSPLDAARILLQAAQILSRYPLLTGLFTERAAIFFLQASQHRKYIFHLVVAGNRLQKSGLRPQRHATVCFAACMLILDKGHWGDLKAKLSRQLAMDLKNQGRDGAQRSLFFMLKMISAMLNENKDVGNKASMSDAVNVLYEIIEEGAWGSIQIGEGWDHCFTRQILLGTLPISPMDILSNDISKSRSEVIGFSVPELKKTTVSLLPTINGAPINHNNIVTSKQTTHSLLSQEQFQKNIQQANNMRIMLEIEQQWMSEVEATSPEQLHNVRSLSDRFAEALEEISRNDKNTSSGGGSNKYAAASVHRVPLGESVSIRMKLCNKFPMDLKLSNVALIAEPTQDFSTSPVELVLSPDVDHEIVLSTKPQKIGQYSVDSARWSLSDYFSVRQPLRKEGALLQKTLQQRLNKDRGESTSLNFEVIASHPLLKMSFEGLSMEALQGQLLKSKLLLRNEGSASACDIYIKLSQPSFVFYLSDQSTNHNSGSSDNSNWKSLIQFYGKSSTVVKLSEDTVIKPGQELQLDAWLRITKPGLQNISLLSSYKALREDGTKDYFGPGQRCRTSFLSIQTRGIPSVGTSLRLNGTPTSTRHHTLVTEYANYMKPPSSSNGVISREDEFGGSSGSRDVRLSSVGQLDLPLEMQLGKSQEHIDVDDNSFKIVGIWLLGAAHPYNHDNSHSNNKNPIREYNLLAAPSERVIGCFPVVVANTTKQESDLRISPDVTASVEQHQGQCSWLKPLANAALTNNDVTIKVIEQFLCITACNEQFVKEVEESRKLLLIAEMEADQAGPRTIAQVRRDRQKQETLANEQAAKQSLIKGQDQGEDSDWEDEDAEIHAATREILEEVDLSASHKTLTPPSSQKASSSEKSSAIESSNAIVPKTAQDIANIEAQKQSITIASIWVCRWESKIRWGVTLTPHLSFVGLNNNNNSNNYNNTAVGLSTKGGPMQQVPSSSSSINSNDTKTAADYLLVGLKYNPRVELSIEKSLEYTCVTLNLQSISDDALVVDLEAIPFGVINSVKLNSSSNNKIGISDDNNNNNNNNIIDKGHNVGFTWNGKTKYSDIQIDPHGSAEVTILALITQPGVYDINRFKISARKSKNLSLLGIKTIPGQCLVEVYEIE